MFTRIRSTLRSPTPRRRAHFGRSSWTRAHRRWISSIKLPNPAQQIAFEEYVQACEEGERRVERFEQAIFAQLEHWRWRPAVVELQALRGISALHAVRLVAELGDFQRFDTPRKLMGYLGVIPSEDYPPPTKKGLICGPMIGHASNEAIAVIAVQTSAVTRQARPNV